MANHLFPRGRWHGFRDLPNQAHPLQRVGLTEQVTSPAAIIRQAPERAGDAARALQLRLDALFLRHEAFGWGEGGWFPGEGGGFRRRRREEPDGRASAHERATRPAV